MKVDYTLICFFVFFSLQDGNTGFVKAKRLLYAVTEGEDVRVECHVSFYREKFPKILCKESCLENILVETTNATAERGRYRIGSDNPESDFSVTIRQVIKSDSGKYRCGYRDGTSATYMPFGIRVYAPPTPKPDVTLPAFSTSLPGAPKETTGPTTPKPDVNLPAFSTPLPGACKQTTDVLLYLVVILVIIVIIFVLVLMIICIRRKTKPDGSTTRGNADGLKIENPLYENDPAVSTPPNSDYLTLHPATRDQNQIYSTLTNTQHT